jgi:glycosyltransferase involved in cell wall biosynthesis
MGSGVLFVHRSFPGQFGRLAEALVARGVPCAGIGGVEAAGVPGVTMARYAVERASTPGVHPLALSTEGDLIRAQAAYEAAKGLKAGGFDPAVIVGHAMFGEMTLLPELFPGARVVLYPEFFLQGPRLAAVFDPEFQTASLENTVRGKSRWAVPALELCDADAIVCPTPFQASVLPEVFRDRVRIIHEGVDVEVVRPGPAKTLVVDGREIVPGTPVITHVNHLLEPLRGLHILARALPKVLAAVPEAQVLIMGEEKTMGYAGEAPGGRTWKEVSLQGVDLDPARVHFLGWVDHAAMHEALRTSTAHVYYSYPYVLSWSLTEALALGCYVIGSDTAPVRDAIVDGANGRLLPFFDVHALSDALIEACRNPQASAPLRAAARQTAVAQFSAEAGTAAWIELLRGQGLAVR